MRKRAALLLAAGALGCGPVGRLRRHDPPRARVEEFTVREIKAEDGALTVRLEIPTAPPGPKPAVIAYLGEGPALRRNGMIAVSYIDARAVQPATSAPAPTVAGKWVLASPSADVLGEGYIRAIARAARDAVPKVIDTLATEPEVDATRLGITGASTYGFTALQALAADQRLGAGVALLSCGDYHSFLRYSSMGMAGEPLALRPAYDRWLREQEIAEHPTKAVHAALLMIDRTTDPLIPIACADATAHALQRAYERAGVAERFRYVRQETGGHDVGVAERQEAVAWLARWLGGAPPAAARAR